MIPRPSSRGVPEQGRAERNRLRILEAALALFAERRGYEGTAIRDIASEAGVSVGLVCRYFPAKEHFALAMYERLANELLQWAAEMPEGTMGARFEATMRKKLSLLAPHRRALVALAARAIDPDARANVLGKSTEVVRSRVAGVFWLAVSGATDAPMGRGSGSRACSTGRTSGSRCSSCRTATGAWRSRRWSSSRRRCRRSRQSPLGAIAALQLDGVFGHLFGTSRAAKGSSEKARFVLDRILRRRRVLPGVAAEPSEAARVLHLPVIQAFIDEGEPVQLALPAFPRRRPTRRRCSAACRIWRSRSR